MYQKILDEYKFFMIAKTNSLSSTLLLARRGEASLTWLESGLV